MTDDFDFMYWKHGWKQGKTLKNGWTLHTNWKYGSKEYRSPCVNWKVERRRDGLWRLMKANRNDAPRWETIITMSKPALCFRHWKKHYGGDEQ